MKLLYSLLIAIVAASVMIGCGNSSKPPTSNNNQGPLQGIEAVKQAIQAFNSKEGHFPKTLAELSPTYLNPLPEPPAGYKFVYNPATGEVKVSR